MKAKKLLALTLALIMALSCMSITAFAEATSYAEDITISVTPEIGDTPATLISKAILSDQANLEITEARIFDTGYTSLDSIATSGTYNIAMTVKLKNYTAFAKSDKNYAGEFTLKGLSCNMFDVCYGWDIDEEIPKTAPYENHTTISYLVFDGKITLYDATLDLEDSTTDILDVATVDQTYTATVNTPKTDKTKVQVSWKLEDITVTVTNNKVWNTEKLTWDEDTSKTNGAAASDPTAEFNFENLSSKDVYAKLTFTKGEKYTEPTKAFTDNDVADGDGIICLGNKATDSTTDNTGKIKLALTVTDSDFDAITSDTTGTYGTYTVTISDKNMATKKTVKATINGNQVDRTGVQLWENGPFFAEFNVGATINSYSSVTTYNTANVGEYYQWGATSTSGDYSTASTDIAGTDADTAKAVWGDNWQMPTSAQLNDLVDKTTWEWCDGSTKQYVSGCTLAGYKVSGKGDYAENSIFLPVAGYIGNADPYGSGIICYCWSSTPYGDSMAWSLSAFSGNKYDSYTNRFYACNVRAIIAED